MGNGACWQAWELIKYQSRTAEEENVRHGRNRSSNLTGNVQKETARKQRPRPQAAEYGDNMPTEKERHQRHLRRGGCTACGLRGGASKKGTEFVGFWKNAKIAALATRPDSIDLSKKPPSLTTRGEAETIKERPS